MSIRYSIIAAIALSVISAVVPNGAMAADPWLVYQGDAEPGKGKHIVLISGDEEYRSEESMPMLGRLLATRLGFKCTVLFAIDAKSGRIDPNVNDNIPGLAALESADLMIVDLRFRVLPDEQMQYIDAYLQKGKPVIGIRPSVVAFRNKPESRFAKYSSACKDTKFAGGFGQQILGSTWVGHHGKLGAQSTRGVIVDEAKSHPILRGVGTMWGPSDVYIVRTPIPRDGKTLVMGQVLSGMKADSAAAEKPLMPLAWTTTYAAENGTTPRVFTTTMGTSQDFLDENYRRMVANACLWAMGMEDQIGPKTNVDLPGRFEPSVFGMNKFRKGVTPGEMGE